MYIGIDVGGTHTDGVLLNEDFAVAERVKTETEEADILSSCLQALKKILAGRDPAVVKRATFSSTLGLNALLTGTADRVGVLATGGPGLAPDLSDNHLSALLGGALDHRGEMLAELNPAEAEKALRRLVDEGAEALAVISKFGPKNPAFEEALAQSATRLAPDLPLTRGSRLSGRLNFPRRLNTAVFNSAIIRLYERFTADLNAAARQMGLNCPLRLLGSDGGTMSLAEARSKPALALAAGPTAGVLGLWALADLDGDVLMMDMGGSSTDLALMADGAPLMTLEGLSIAGRPTLLRSFLTQSLALGGDSALRLEGDRVMVGPRREGPALALRPAELGRRAPTFTDALNVLELCRVGSSEISRQALEQFHRAPAEETAALALNSALEAIKSAAADFLDQVNNRPVYTLGELRLARSLRPARLALLGGPAPALARAVSGALGLPVSLPPEAQVANAVGAASARPALSAELYADTALGIMSIPALGVAEKIPRGYDIQEAQRNLLARLDAVLEPQAGEPRLIEAETFNQLTGYGRADKIFRLRAQAAPGLLQHGAKPNSPQDSGSAAGPSSGN